MDDATTRLTDDSAVWLHQRQGIRRIARSLGPGLRQRQRFDPARRSGTRLLLRWQRGGESCMGGNESRRRDSGMAPELQTGGQDAGPTPRGFRRALQDAGPGAGLRTGWGRKPGRGEPSRVRGRARDRARSARSRAPGTRLGASSGGAWPDSLPRSVGPRSGRAPSVTDALRLGATHGNRVTRGPTLSAGESGRQRRLRRPGGAPAGARPARPAPPGQCPQPFV
jgi:hypothetical protein